MFEAMWHGEFRHPRAVQVYDATFGWSRQDDFFVDVANEAPGSRVVDLGCGTGRLALGLAAAGHDVTAADPAVASLDVARAKPGAEAVTWVVGTSHDLPTESFDLAVMSSNVSGFFVDDAAWQTALAGLRRCLVPHGRLVFDARDPQARHWESWTRALSARVVMLDDGTAVEFWSETPTVLGDTVRFFIHYVFDDGEVVVAEAQMRFRSLADIVADVEAAGFAVEHVYGGWQRQPVGEGDEELIVLARRT